MKNGPPGRMDAGLLDADRSCVNRFPIRTFVRCSCGGGSAPRRLPTAGAKAGAAAGAGASARAGAVRDSALREPVQAASSARPSGRTPAAGAAARPPACGTRRSPRATGSRRPPAGGGTAGRPRRAAASTCAEVGWSGPCSKSGRLLTTLLKPRRATSAIAAASSCGATNTSSVDLAQGQGGFHRRSSGRYLFSAALTAAETWPMSALPASLALTAAITLPMSPGPDGAQLGDDRVDLGLRSPRRPGAPAGSPAAR